MFICLLLSLVLTTGQNDPDQSPAVAESKPEAPPAAVPAPAPSADRWLLMKLAQGTWPGTLLDTERMKVYGWTEGCFTASTDSHSNLPMGMNYLANQGMLEQNWLRFERSVVKSGTTEPTFGFRCDTILPGTDYRFTTARGLFSGQLTANNGQPNTYGIDPVQFYAEAYFPTIAQGMDVKVGRFFAQYGVESIDAISTPLPSRAYTFVYDPFTQTGILTTTQLTRAWSVQAGAVLGSDVFIDPAANPTFIGSAKWAPPDGRDSVLASVIAGAGRFNQARNFHNPEVFDFIYTHRFNPRLNYTLETLYGFTSNVPDIGFANWLGVINYLAYDFTPRLTGITRLEFFDDVQGQRTGFAGLYTALTAGAAFRPCPDLILRPEVRYDYNGQSAPFEGRHGLFTATVDVIVRW